MPSWPVSPMDSASFANCVACHYPGFMAPSSSIKNSFYHQNQPSCKWLFSQSSLSERCERLFYMTMKFAFAWSRIQSLGKSQSVQPTIHLSMAVFFCRCILQSLIKTSQKMMSDDDVISLEGICLNLIYVIFSGDTRASWNYLLSHQQWCIPLISVPLLEIPVAFGIWQCVWCS